MKKQVLISIIFILSFICAFSQELDSKYTPKGGIFGETYKKKSTSSEISNVISYNPTLLTRSTNALFYERKITSDQTLKVGVGKHLGEDWILFEIGGSVDIKQADSEISIYKATNNSFLTSSTPFLSLSYKYYYDNELLDGVYVELNYRRGTFNYEADSRIDSYEVVGSKDYTLNISSLHIIFGNLSISSGRLKFTHDFYIGLGLRSLKFNAFKMDSYIDSFTGDAEYIYVISTQKTSNILPSIVAGYSLGFGF
jgi:hypothetical protein